MMSSMSKDGLVRAYCFQIGVVGLHWKAREPIVNIIEQQIIALFTYLPFSRELTDSESVRHLISAMYIAYIYIRVHTAYLSGSHATRLFFYFDRKNHPSKLKCEK